MTASSASTPLFASLCWLFRFSAYKMVYNSNAAHHRPSATPGVVKAATYVPAIPCQSFLAIDDETWEAIVAVAERTRMDFQELAKEAFADLLKKHKQPVGLKAALKESVDERVNRRSKK